MLWVLFGSLILAVATLAAVWAWYYGPFAKDQHRMAIHPPGVRNFTTRNRPGGSRPTHTAVAQSAWNSNEHRQFQGDPQTGATTNFD